MDLTDRGIYRLPNGYHVIACYPAVERDYVTGEWREGEWGGLYTWEDWQGETEPTAEWNLSTGEIQGGFGSRWTTDDLTPVRSRREWEEIS